MKRVETTTAKRKTNKKQKQNKNTQALLLDKVVNNKYEIFAVMNTT